jgi:hypothetical protein
MTETNPESSGEENGAESFDNNFLSCPRCGSERLHRSHRRNGYERTFIRIVGLRPYRCESCNFRFHSWRRKIAK